jgi:hypothetical protein
MGSQRRKSRGRYIGGALAREKSVDGRVAIRHDVAPMTYVFTAETQLQGPTPLSFGAHACEPRQLLGTEERSGRRNVAKIGDPGTRW